MTHATESVNTTPAKCVSVLKISSRLRRDSFFSSIESRAARPCLLAAYAEEVEHGGGNGEEGGVEAVEHAAVSRQDIARVFDAQLPFEEALYEVAPRAEHADGKREAYPINQFHFPIFERVLSLSSAPKRFSVSTALIIPSRPGGEIKSNFSKSVIPSSLILRTTSERSVL